MEKKHAVNGGYPLHTYSDLQEAFFPYITDPKSRDMIKEAYEMAKKYHTGQVRKSGEDYIHHLIEVGYILAKLQAGPATIAAGFLHDVIEDTHVDKSAIAKQFGTQIAELVDGVSKLTKMTFENKAEAQAETALRLPLSGR